MSRLGFFFVASMVLHTKQVFIKGKNLEFKPVRILQCRIDRQFLANINLCKKVLLMEKINLCKKYMHCNYAVVC